MITSLAKRWIIGLSAAICLLFALCITSYATNLNSSRENQELNAKLSDANEQIAVLSTNKARSDYDDVQNNITQGKLDTANETIASLENDINLLQDDIRELGKDVHALTLDKITLQQEIERYKLYMAADDSDAAERAQYVADLEKQLSRMTLDQRIDNTYTLEQGHHQTGDVDWGYWIYDPHLPGNPEEQPLVVYLHGTGGSGHSLDTLINEDRGLAYMIYNQNVRPNCLCLMPQSSNSWTSNHDELAELIQWAVKEYHANPKQVTLIGGSAGGIACFEMLFQYQDLFCCAVPFGASTFAEKCSVIKIPIRIYHGTADYGMGFSVEDANRIINENGGSSELIMMPGLGHTEQECLYDTKWGLWKWIYEQNEKALLQ